MLTLIVPMPLMTLLGCTLPVTPPSAQLLAITPCHDSRVMMVVLRPRLNTSGGPKR